MARITTLVLVLLGVLVLHTERALAWGYQGHEVVGAIADALIADNANAKKQVRDILNGPPPSEAEIKLQKELRVWRELTLREAGPWPDCVKAVVRHDGNRFKYELDPEHPEYETACIPFNAALERARMEDYAKRNWTSCSYVTGGVERGCHNTFHFTDVAIQRKDYALGEAGTNDHDLVAAVNACIAVLMDRPAPGPFSIRDKKEALLLLVHFVGDLHQPLHVGAVYLDREGAKVDPDADVRPHDAATETAGGNLIWDENVNLHAEWDDIPFDIGRKANRDLLNAARAVPATGAAMEDWARLWATASLKAAQDAFDGLTFAPSVAPIPPKWTVMLPDRAAYQQRADAIKRQQLAKAGARLAQILNAIWPRN
ncbi:MAG: S1/P1 nuclease [Bradyrhizobium sp.]